MKKRLLIGISFLCITCFASSVYATEVSMDTENKEVKPGDTVTVKIAIKDIDIEEGINVIQGRFRYDKEVFEKVNNQDITSVNSWSMSYNDENTNSEGKFVVLKLASSVKENQDILEMNLKVKENAYYTNTSIEIQELCTVDGDNIVNLNDSKVDVKVNGKFSLIRMFFNWIKNIFV